jgi:hypothetical protein
VPAAPVDMPAGPCGLQVLHGAHHHGENAHQGEEQSHVGRRPVARQRAPLFLKRLEHLVDGEPETLPRAPYAPTPSTCDPPPSSSASRPDPSGLAPVRSPCVVSVASSCDSSAGCGGHSPISFDKTFCANSAIGYWNNSRGQERHDSRDSHHGQQPRTNGGPPHPFRNAEGPVLISH